MPKSNQRVFKKRKRVFTGRHIHCKSGGTEIISEIASENNASYANGISASNSNEEVIQTFRTSSSSDKFGNNIEAYEKYEENEQLNDCYDLINLQTFHNLLSKIAVCSKCNGQLCVSSSNRRGLSVSVNIKCNNCDVIVCDKNSEIVNKKAAMNVRLAYAFRCIGKGEEAARNFCGIMNLPSPSEFRHYNKILLQSTKEICTRSMGNAIEECVQETGTRDITAIFDGSWQHRGHTSQNGVVSAISETNGKVIDVRILTKFCRCKGRLNDEHDVTCTANYSGVSGGMEVQGILDMFQKSEATNNVRYKYFLGDGDSSAYSTVARAEPYGPDFPIEKLECVGHVQKRMGSRLRKLKTKMGKAKLHDGKTLGGRDRLTDKAINEIQIYYGLAIRRNVLSLEAMKTAVWAEYFHLSSTNDMPAHELCPKGPESWCKFQVAKANNEPYDHNQHTHYPKPVMDEIKSIFRDLANHDLLRRFLHGKTQNACESLNNVIWTRLPKSTFVLKSTLELGVYEAIATYNEGNISRCQILEKLGISPGKNCVARMKEVDRLRIKRANKALEEIEKKCRQKKTLAKRRLEDAYEEAEDPDNPSYGAGMH